MLKFVKKFLAMETIRYIIVGGFNTVLGWVLMYIFPNLLHMSYWPSSITAFVIGSAISYFLNRNFTFKAQDQPHIKTLPRFVLNLTICYFLANVPTKLLLDSLFSSLELGISEGLQTTIKLLVGNVVFIIINYLGQKFFAFRKTDSAQKTDNAG